jgi:hypothetical protein
MREILRIQFQNQFCESGSARIHIDLAALDPDPYWESISRAWKLTHIKKGTVPSFQPFKKAFVLSYVYVC